MLKEESYDVLDLDVNKQNWARVCDVCRSAACSVYCGADAAYLCGGCDARVHAASNHERVAVCEACEGAPAAVLCKADAASLCASCDSAIHSANPLARRHHRVTILPISGTLYCPPTANPCRKSSMMIGLSGDAPEENGFLTEETNLDEDEDEAASWLLLNPNPAKKNNEISCAVEAVDAYLDLAEFSSCHDSQFDDKYSINQNQHYSVPQNNMSYGGDSVVPNHGKTQLQYNHNRNFQLKGMEYENFNTGYGYPPSINNCVSISSIDVGIVPESTMTEVSISHSRPSIQMPPTQLTQIDREARVLRYREKKKTRKFEKTIRYASRKAYAETRPRIKGRFAKRTDGDTEVDQMFCAPFMAEIGYGIVPSF